MKKIFLIYICIISLSNSLFAQSFVIYADKCFGGSGLEWPTRIMKTTDGNLILTGESDSNISGNKTVADCDTNGPSGIWMLKIDKNFNILWEKDIGGNDVEGYPTIQYNSLKNNLIFSCESISDSSCNKTENDRTNLAVNNQDYWVGTLDTAGTIIWEKTLGGFGQDDCPEIMQLTTNDYIVCGSSESYTAGADKTVPNYGSADIWVIKLDSSGHKIWDKVYGGIGSEGSQYPNPICSLLPSANGDFIISGSTASPVSGNVTIPSKGSSDFWILKLDSAGTILWQKRYGGTNGDFSSKIIATNDGGYLVGGTVGSPQGGDVSESSRGGQDFWVIKIDSMGNKQWDKRYGGTGSDQMFWVEPANEGGYLIGGTSSSPMGLDVSEPKYGGNDYWIVKIDSIGNKEWDKRFGGPVNSYMNSFTQLADSSIVVFGRSDTGTTAVKTDPGYGGYDYWVLRFKYLYNTVGINEIAIYFNSVSVFPNPTKDLITINSSSEKIKQIELFNIVGESLYTQKINNLNSAQLNLQGYAPGFYLVKISGEKYSETKKVLKE